MLRFSLIACLVALAIASSAAASSVPAPRQGEQAARDRLQLAYLDANDSSVLSGGRYPALAELVRELALSNRYDKGQRLYQPTRFTTRGIGSAVTVSLNRSRTIVTLVTRASDGSRFMLRGGITGNGHPFKMPALSGGVG